MINIEEKVKQPKRKSALLPIAIVSIAIIVTSASGAVFYRSQMHNKVESTHLEQDALELSMLSLETPESPIETTEESSEPQEESISPTPTATPSQIVKAKTPNVKGTISSHVATKTPTPTPTVLATPQAKAKQSDAIAIESCRATAKNKTNIFRNDLKSKSPGPWKIASASTVGEAERMAIQYGYWTQDQADRYRDKMMEYAKDNLPGNVQLADMYSAAYWADIADLQNNVIKTVQELEDVIKDYEDAVYSECINDL